MSNGDRVPVRPLERIDILRSRVVDHLVAAIFNGQLSQGDRLIVQRLAAQLGISATPVREALVEMASLGFVEMAPNRGAVCRAFGRAELRELYQLRRVLEVEATRSACGRIPESDLMKVRDALAELRMASPGHDHAEWSNRAQTIDLQLHELVHSFCGSDRLRHEIGRYADLMRSFRREAGNKRNVQIKAIDEHLAIVDALLACDADRACRCMGDHIRSTASSVEAIVFGEENAPGAGTAGTMEARR